MKLLAIALLLSTVLVVLSIQSTTAKPSHKPAARGRQEVHEEARRRWSGAKRLYRRHVRKPHRFRRDTPASSQQSIGSQADSVKYFSLPGNHSGSSSKYIFDLYNNLSKSPESSALQLMQANTVRSLETVTTVPTCDTFNFSVEIVGNAEYITRSELYLFMNRERPQLESIQVAIIGNDKENGIIAGTRHVTAQDVYPDKKFGWLVFDVRQTLLHIRENHETHAVFKIQLYRNSLDVKTPLSCEDSPIRFNQQSQAQPDINPYLTVHSYNPEIEKIDYTAILNIRRNNTVLPQANPPSRQRRQGSLVDTELPPSCQVNELIIQHEDISMLWVRSDDEILSPSSYNAGICGGSCGSTLPSSNELKHTPIVHILVRLEKFEDHEYSFTQCCAPVQYAPLQLLIRPRNRPGFYMVVVHNMIIRACECLEVIDFSKSNPTNKR